MNNTNTASNLFTTRIAIQNIDETSIQKAKELFQNFQKDGVIFSGTFESNEWGCSDQYARLHIRFNVDPFLYKRYYEKMLGINLETFVSYIKAYAMCCMGTYGLECIRGIVNDVKRLVKEDFRELYAADEILNIYHPNHMVDFFTMLPVAENAEEFDYLMGLLDNILDFVRANSSADQARDLASFDSYFLFNDILNDYWKMNLPMEERLFFYPLYLWWKITGVIPLRPREFILTQRDCLHKKEDGYYLMLRRNHLKGSGRSKHYKVPDDYFTVEYKIPDSLAQEILIYLDYTKDYTATELDTLFITDTHYIHWNKRKRYDSRFFTYANLNCVLRYFYKDVIIGKYHLTVQNDRTLKYLNKGEIHRIYLGDTRHLALINIIAEGGTPVLAMMLAGHDDMETSAHYYSNITSLIECRTYSQYRKVIQGDVRYELSRVDNTPPDIRSCIPLRDGGRCYSSCYRNRDFSDCEKTIGPKGEIGYCPNCTFYRKASDEDFLADDSVYKRKIEDDCRYLEKITHSVRTMDGDKEDILKAFLRLKSSSYDYETFLKEKERYKLWQDQQR